MIFAVTLPCHIYCNIHVKFMIHRRAGVLMFLSGPDELKVGQPILKPSACFKKVWFAKGL